MIRYVVFCFDEAISVLYVFLDKLAIKFYRVQKRTHNNRECQEQVRILYRLIFCFQGNYLSMTLIEKLDPICKTKIYLYKLMFISSSSSSIRITLSFLFFCPFLMQFFARGCLESHRCEHIMRTNKNRITQADWCDVYICYVLLIVFFRMTSTGRCPHHINKHMHLFFSFFRLILEIQLLSCTKKNDERIFFFSCSYYFFFLYMMYVFVRRRQFFVIWMIICLYSIGFFLVWAYRL